MTVLAIINQKGGVGKTSTALALTAGLFYQGYRTLGIDLDAQSNFTYTCQAKTDGATSLDILIGQAEIQEAIQHTQAGDVIAASKALSGSDNYITATGKEYRLREALEPIEKDYDYIILDTPPALGILSINALTACNKAIIPAQADIYSLHGIKKLAETISPVRKYCNPGLFIDGILLTRYNARSILSRDVTDLAEQLAENLGTKVYAAKIREGVAVKEAQIMRQTLFDYAPKAKVTEDYQDLIAEFLKGETS